MRDEITTPHTDSFALGIVKAKEEIITKAIAFKLGREDWYEHEIKSRCAIKFTGNNTEIFVMDDQEMVMFSQLAFHSITTDDTVKIGGAFEYKELYLAPSDIGEAAPLVCPGGGKCEKERHLISAPGGYLHEPDYDGPYRIGSRGWLPEKEDKDDPLHCGRCHKRLKGEG